MAVVRIFSYLPNPRVWKSLIAAKHCGVKVELVGDQPANLGSWLWDYDARQLAESELGEDNPNARTGRRGFSGLLYKTDEFLKAQPYGTVPAAFTGDDRVGVFESNSILRAVVRASQHDHGLYGNNPAEASRIDSFLDASLVFAREAQVYLLVIKAMTNETHARMKAAYEFYLDGIERALGNGPFIATNELTMADICFACDFSQFMRERFMSKHLVAHNLDTVCKDFAGDYPNAYRHLINLAGRDEFAEHFGDYLEGV